MPRTLRFEWEVPDELFDAPFREEDFRPQLKADAVVRLFTQGRLSSGSAASLLEMTRRDFLALLHPQGVPFVHDTQEEREKALRTIQALAGKSPNGERNTLQDA